MIKIIGNIYFQVNVNTSPGSNRNRVQKKINILTVIVWWQYCYALSWLKEKTINDQFTIYKENSDEKNENINQYKIELENLLLERKQRIREM